ncbi:MAG: transposase [Thermodesulfovibrio sp.]|nr:transposase [Thermodesulfovibrio sp.]
MSTYKLSKKLQSKFDSYKELLFKGAYPALSVLAENILNLLMLAEQEHFLKENSHAFPNGFYSRSLYTHFTKLNLKISRIIQEGTFRPALLPQHWQPLSSNYETFLLACLAKGYFKAKIKYILQKLNLPFSKNALENLS